VPRCPRLRRRRRRAAPRCTHQGCRAARAAGTPRSGCCRSTSQGAKCERLSTTLRGGRLEASAGRHTSLELAERVASPMQRTAHATRLGFSSALCVVPSDSLSAPPSMCYSNALGSTVTVPSCPRAYPAARCSFLNEATRCWRNSACGCGLHIHEQSGQPRSEGFEKVRRFLFPSERPLWWSSLYSRASFT
jgi:hypothetical protein